MKVKNNFIFVITDQSLSRYSFGVIFIKKSHHKQQHTYIDNTFHIIYFENLIDELKNIECFKEVIDFNNYPTLNASSNSKRNYNEIYDKELKDLVFNKYKKDFELFGYEY